MSEPYALTVADAEAFLKAHERHYKMPAETVCAIGLSDAGELHGAAILGRTKDGNGIIGHIYVDGTFQGYTLLYGACLRAFHALGYKVIIIEN